MPTWFAFPPETHSALLSAGPGPSTLLAAAAQLQELAGHYLDAAAQLSGQLGVVQSGVWEGASAERFVASYQPFLVWLGDASAAAAKASAQYETVAAGYSSALAAMPALGELAANHAAHAALTATNFLGINTVPIASNEADYARMWVQAAETMTTYQSVSEQSLASMPSASPAPRVLATSEDSSDNDSTDPVKWLNAELQKVADRLGDLAESILPGPLANIVTQLMNSLSSFIGGQTFNIISHAVLDPIIYMGPFAPLLSPMLSFAAPGAAGLIGLVGAAQPAGELVQPAEPGRPAQLATATPPTTGASVGMSAPVQAPSSSAPPATSTSPSAPPPQLSHVHVAQSPAQPGPGGGEGFPPVVGASAWSSAGASRGASGSASESAGAGGLAALAGYENEAAVASRRRARQYRMRFLEQDGRMTLSEAAGPEPAAFAGEQGAGLLGTSRSLAPASAAGLAWLHRGVFDTSPQVPLLPQTWSGEQARD